MSLLDYYKPLPKDFGTRDAADTLHELAVEFVDKHETAGSLELLSLLETQGRSLSADAKQRLAKTRRLLQFAALSALPKATFVEFIETSAVQFIPNQEMDLFREIRNRIIAVDGSIADEEKEVVRKALDRNVERIGSQDLTIGSEILPPTGANWIKAYRAKAGTNDRGSITRSQFLFDEPAAVALTESERNVLADLLYLYDLMGVPTGQPGAIDTLDPYLFLNEPGLELDQTFEELREEEEQERAEITKRVSQGVAPTTSTEAVAQRPSAPPKRSLRLPTEERKTPPAPATPQKNVVREKPQPNASEQPKRKKLDVGRAPLPSAVKPAPEQPAAAPFVQPTQAPQKKAEPKMFTELNQVSDISALSLHALRNAKGGPVAAIKNAAQQAAGLIAAAPGDLAVAQKTWKQTELYKVYIEMGNESMSSSKNIAQVSEERKQLKKPVLTPEEFEAVAELSRVFTS
ncbi:MAG: hypothetical protein KC925_03390 [Candidatus Doudnabacteria bacterium]|nr:hypothetical protein [Candidatus Doudnabacteria bacterium]